MTEFWIPGQPAAKQSFRYSSRGGGYTSPHVTEWEQRVRLAAREVILAGAEKLPGEVRVRLDFFLNTKRRVDLDNLSKAVLDGLKDVLFGDDCEMVELHLTKAIDRREPGVMVQVEKM